jgi:hypothetical protein
MRRSRILEILFQPAFLSLVIMLIILMTKSLTSGIISNLMFLCSCQPNPLVPAGSMVTLLTDLHFNAVG